MFKGLKQDVEWFYYSSSKPQKQTWLDQWVNKAWTYTRDWYLFLLYLLQNLSYKSSLTSGHISSFSTVSFSYFQGHTWKEGNTQGQLKYYLFSSNSFAILCLFHPPSFSQLLFPPFFPLYFLSFLSFPSDFYPTHHLRARAVLYPERVAARISSQMPITTFGPCSWTLLASQRGLAWDAGAGGEFWWIRGPGQATRVLREEVTGVDQHDCTCEWWRWWSTHSYLHVKWMETGCVLQASCALIHSLMNLQFWKDFSRTSQDPMNLFPLTWRSVVMVTALTCWRSWQRTWASLLTSILLVMGSMGGSRMVAGQDWWVICSVALPTWQWLRLALIQPEVKSLTSPLPSSPPVWEFWSVLLCSWCHTLLFLIINRFSFFPSLVLYHSLAHASLLSVRQWPHLNSRAWYAGGQHQYGRLLLLQALCDWILMQFPHMGLYWWVYSLVGWLYYCNYYS